MSTVKRKCKVVMLPTAREPYKMPYDKNIPESNLILGLQESLNYSKTLGFKKSPAENRFPSRHSIGNYSKEMYQNLYILSDEEIEEGDWVYINLGENSRITKVESLSGKHPIFNVEIEEGCAELKTLKKIIATTDTSLTKTVSTFDFISQQEGEIEVPALPKPSPQFINKYMEEYNKGNVIEEVMIEYEEVDSQEYHAEIDYKGKSDIDIEYEVKVDKQNCITITKVNPNYEGFVTELWERESKGLPIDYRVLVKMAKEYNTPIPKKD